MTHQMVGCHLIRALWKRNAVKGRMSDTEPHSFLFQSFFLWNWIPIPCHFPLRIGKEKFHHLYVSWVFEYADGIVFLLWIIREYKFGYQYPAFNILLASIFQHSPNNRHLFLLTLSVCSWAATGQKVHNISQYPSASVVCLSGTFTLHISFLGLL